MNVNNLGLEKFRATRFRPTGFRATVNIPPLNYKTNLNKLRLHRLRPGMAQWEGVNQKWGRFWCISLDNIFLKITHKKLW